MNTTHAIVTGTVVAGLAGLLSVALPNRRPVSDIVIPDFSGQQVSSNPIEEKGDSQDGYGERDYDELNPAPQPTSPVVSYAPRIRQALYSGSTTEKADRLRAVIDDYICHDLPRSMMIIDDRYVKDDSESPPVGRSMTIDLMYGLKGSSSLVTALETLHDLMTGYGDDDSSSLEAFVVYGRKALHLEDAVADDVAKQTISCQQKGERK